MQKRWATFFILLCLGLVPLAMVLSQWLMDDAPYYGINGESLPEVHFRWQDSQLQWRRFPEPPYYTYLFLGFLSCSEICPIRIAQLTQLEQGIAKDNQLKNAPYSIFVYLH